MAQRFFLPSITSNAFSERAPCTARGAVSAPVLQPADHQGPCCYDSHRLMDPQGILRTLSDEDGQVQLHGRLAVDGTIDDEGAVLNGHACNPRAVASSKGRRGHDPSVERLTLCQQCAPERRDRRTAQALDSQATSRLRRGDNQQRHHACRKGGRCLAGSHCSRWPGSP